MELGRVSALDCLAFCVFLAPQLIWRVGLVETTLCALQCLPYLVLRLPFELVWERYFVRRAKRSPFAQRAAPFEDLVIRCVRYAFANIDPRIGRVFFSKEVTLPFLRFRLLRHGYLKAPIYWRDYQGEDFRGLWIVKEPLLQPDFVLYYAHGGGFSMGSTYFYLEFFMSWMTLLQAAGYKNPAIFGIEYTLVPEASFPTQLRELVKGYEHVLTVARDPSLVCVSGDSAGATLVLSLLLHLGNPKSDQIPRPLPQPRFAVLISPWVTLLSSRHQNTTSDFLDARALHRYALQYVGPKISTNDPLASPGSCKDLAWWQNASPAEGFFITYGEEEVFAQDIQDLLAILRKSDAMVEDHAEAGGIHAWPVASLFLSASREKRLHGLKTIVEQISMRMQ